MPLQGTQGWALQTRGVGGHLEMVQPWGVAWALGVFSVVPRAECGLGLSLTESPELSPLADVFGQRPFLPHHRGVAVQHPGLAQHQQHGASAPLGGLQSSPETKELYSVPWSDHHLPAGWCSTAVSGCVSHR